MSGAPRDEDAIEQVIDPALVGFDTSERERRFALVGLAVSATACLVVPLVSLATDSQALCAFACVPSLGLLTSLAFLSIALAPGGAKLVPARVEIRGGELWIRPQRMLARSVRLADIVQGHREDPDRVVLAIRAREAITIAPGLDADGACDRLLRACGVSAGERVLRVPLSSAASRLPGGALFVALAFATVALSASMVLLAMVGLTNEMAVRPSLDTIGPLVIGALIFFAPLAGLGYGLLRSLLRREVVVGTDGVVFRGALRTKRLRFADVAAVKAEPRGVRLHRRDGSSLLLPVVGARKARPEEEARRSALLGRIEEALRAREVGAVARPGVEELDRRGRSVAAWRGDLRRIAVSDAGYRSAGLTRVDLASVIDDAAAPVERRIAAVLALGAGEPEEARRRVRIAVDACADEEIKRALEQAAEGEVDEALIEREAKRVQRS